MSTSNVQVSRFIGLDVHKHYVMLGAVDGAQNVVLRPRRLSFAEFETWWQRYLTASDAVVLEASCNSWHLYDQLSTRAASVTVANPLLVKWIAAARVKTDAHDTIKLARLLAAGLIPAVWVPPQPVRDLRALLSHRQRLIRERTQARNRLHSLLQRHNLTAAAEDLFSSAQRTWWQSLPWTAAERLLVIQDLQLLEALQPLLEQTDVQLRHASVQAPWAEQVPFLLQQTGIGVLTAMTLLAAIGDITRFAHPSQLVGYAGLGAGVHASGQTHHGGGITKQGRRDLRAAMVEAAWTAVRENLYWKTKFERYAQRLGKPKAIVAIARQMLVVVWHLWHKREVDRHTDAATIARKLMTWAEQGGKTMRQGQTATAFVRQQLDQLGIGAELTALKYGSHIYKLPLSKTAAVAN
jgi:transposase